MSMTQTTFELTLYGGAVERRYRRLRPEVEDLPWATLRPEDAPRDVVDSARRTWTEAAFQEHRTGAACAATLEALIVAQAPLDLIAMASRFPLDEMVHVEMCARLVAQLGGAVRLVYRPGELFAKPPPEATALMRAAELVVRNFCVGEALSIPMLRGSWHAAKHPLIKEVLCRIVKDEAAHGQFGWMFLDWADAFLSDEERKYLAQAARQTIAAVTARWTTLPVKDNPLDAEALGWMETQSYLQLAQKSLQTHVIEPLRDRGIEI